MRPVLLALAVLAAIPSLPAKAGTNVPLCFALSEQYARCRQEAERQDRRGWGYGGYGGYGHGGWGHDGWGNGYGYGHGGYGGGYGGYYAQRRQERSQAKWAQCAQILVAMQQNRCVN